MRRLLIICCFIIIIYPVSADAVAGVGFGGKVGIAKLSGDILPSSGDVGSALYYGVVMEISTFPMLDLELHVNYLQQDFDYTFDIGGVPIQESFTFRDLSGLAMLKKNLIAVPMSPVKLPAAKTLYSV